MKRFDYRNLSAPAFLAIISALFLLGCDASWEAKYNTSNSTVTTYDSKTGYRLTTVAAKDKPTEKTWSMLMACSGQLGTPGVMQNPPSPEDRENGKVPDLSQSTFLEQTVAFNADDTPLTPLPDTNAMRAKLQAECDSKINSSPR